MFIVLVIAQSKFIFT